MGGGVGVMMENDEGGWYWGLGIVVGCVDDYEMICW